MTPAEFADYLFGVATGWLGYSHADAYAMTLPALFVTLKARIEWERMKAGVPSEEQEPVDKQAQLKAMFSQLADRKRA